MISNTRAHLNARRLTDPHRALWDRWKLTQLRRDGSERDLAIGDPTRTLWKAAGLSTERPIDG
jgi:hypothetical protein